MKAEPMQESFLEPIAVPPERPKAVPKRAKKKEKVVKEEKQPPPKKSEIVLISKTSNGVPVAKSKQEINSLIRGAVREFVKNNNQFSVYALLGAFHSDSYNIVKDWYLDYATNREWVFLRLINAGIFPDDNEFQEFYKKWRNR